MKLLLDTHALLWFFLNDDRLSNDAQSLIAAPENDLLLSPASCWEIAIKISLGKYSLGEGLEAFLTREIAENSLTILPITPKHVSIVAELPFHHRDPFDRLLIVRRWPSRYPYSALTRSLISTRSRECGNWGVGETTCRTRFVGQPIGPGMFDCLEVFGLERALARIDQALERV